MKVGYNKAKNIVAIQLETFNDLQALYDFVNYGGQATSRVEECIKPRMKRRKWKHGERLCVLTSEIWEKLHESHGEIGSEPKAEPEEIVLDEVDF